MSTLSSALSLALSGLSVTSAQSALASRNVNSASVEGYTRKTAEIYVLPGGAPTIAGYQRSTDKALVDKLLGSTSTSLEKDSVLSALTRLSQLTGDPADANSLTAALGRMQQALMASSSNPADSSLTLSALEASRTVAAKLNAAANEADAVRSNADSEMAQSVSRINSLLQSFKAANDTIVRGTGTPEELSETLDQRDNILRQLSEEIGIRTVTRPNNDVLIFATGGAVLFEATPRTVSFSETRPLGAGDAGAAVLIDGVPVTGASATMPISGGKLSGAAQVRDQLAPKFISQLDEIARGLIEAFAEFDQSPSPSLPPVAGLFVDPGSGLPGTGGAPKGIAGRLVINALADPEQGGNPSYLRDGGFGGASYVYNSSGLSGYQSRLKQLAEGLDRAWHSTRPRACPRTRASRNSPRSRQPGSRRSASRRAMLPTLLLPCAFAPATRCRRSPASASMPRWPPSSISRSPIRPPRRSSPSSMPCWRPCSRRCADHAG